MRFLRDIAKAHEAPYIQVDEKIEYSAQKHSLKGQEIAIREINRTGKCTLVLDSIVGVSSN